MCVVSVTDAKGLGVRPAHQHALLPAITFAPAAFSYVQGGTRGGGGAGRRKRKKLLGGVQGGVEWGVVGWGGGVR